MASKGTLCNLAPGGCNTKFKKFRAMGGRIEVLVMKSRGVKEER
jgi:hypothetical protein